MTTHVIQVIGPTPWALPFGRLIIVHQGLRTLTMVEVRSGGTVGTGAGP